MIGFRKGRENGAEYDQNPIQGNLLEGYHEDTPPWVALLLYSWNKILMSNQDVCYIVHVFLLPQVMEPWTSRLVLIISSFRSWQRSMKTSPERSDSLLSFTSSVPVFFSCLLDRVLLFAVVARSVARGWDCGQGSPGERLDHQEEQGLQRGASEAQVIYTSQRSNGDTVMSSFLCI